jgi:hypothetical protein
MSMTSIEMEHLIHGIGCPQCNARRGDWCEREPCKVHPARSRAYERRQTLKRSTAEKMLADLLSRAAAINASDDFAYRISHLAVFGSYLRNADRLGDLDVCYRLAPRDLPGSDAQEAREKKRFDLAKQAGRRFSGIARYCWPQLEVVQLLKASTPRLSLHDADDLLGIGAPYQVILGDPNSIFDGLR